MINYDRAAAERHERAHRALVLFDRTVRKELPQLLERYGATGYVVYCAGGIKAHGRTQEEALIAARRESKGNGVVPLVYVDLSSGGHTHFVGNLRKRPLGHGSVIEY